MASIIINPVDGNNIINAANAAAGVTFTGTETGLDGQQLLFTFVGARNSPSDFQDIVGFTLGDDFVPVTANNGTWSYTLPSEVATKLLDSAGGPPYSAEIIDVQNNAIVASAQENVIVSEGNTQPVITVNPINNATDIITPINALQGITVSGTETGFDGQTVTVDLGTLNSGPGTPPAETQFATTVTAQNGMWSANIPADAVLALPVDTAGYDIGASVQLPNGTGTDATFFAERNLQSERLTLTDTAAGLEALTAAQINSLHAFGVSAIASTGPADTEFSAAQVKALENDGIAVSGPTGVQIELSDIKQCP